MLLLEEAVPGMVTYHDFHTDAARFGSALSGRAEYRFRTPQAARIRDLAG